MTKAVANGGVEMASASTKFEHPDHKGKVVILAVAAGYCMCRVRGSEPFLLRESEVDKIIDNSPSSAAEPLNDPFEGDLSRIVRRIRHATIAYAHDDMESAGLHLWPALDDTARRRYGGSVSNRTRKFVNEFSRIVTYIAWGSQDSNISLSGESVFDFLYNGARNTLLHNGGDDPRLHWTDGSFMGLGGSFDQNGRGSIAIPRTFMLGLIVSVVLAKENAECVTEVSLGKNVLQLGDSSFSMATLWGKERWFLETVIE